MDSWPIQHLILVMVPSLLYVTASSSIANITNGTIAVSTPSWKNHSTKSQTYLRFSDDRIVNVTRYEVTMGKSIKFDCDAIGYPFPTIRWQKNGRPLEKVSYRFESLASFHSFQLHLDNVLLPDAGHYTCTVMSGNMSQTRSFILNVLEKKETTKPVIQSFIPQNLTVVTGKAVHMQCFIDRQLNMTQPFIKLIKYIKFSAETNETKSWNITEKLQKELTRIIKRGKISPYTDKNYEVIKGRYSVTVMETLSFERSFSVNYVIDHVDMVDNAVYSCIAFNDAGFSKETIYLHVIQPPTPSIYELAIAYASKFSDSESKEQVPLAVTVCLPVMVLVILTIGFVWWKENVKIKLKEEKLSLIKIKKLRELDNFSSLEHMEKFSSRMETKRSSFVSECVGSGVVDDHFEDEFDCNDQAHDRLLGNGHTTSFSTEGDRKPDSAKAPEVIQLQDMEPITSETPVTGRSSAFGSHSELEWEPVDLKLNLPTRSEFSQILDTSA